ncbi:TetR family transcriptional regulator C-terminal domain-containing protein, partial [Lysinibacillus sp. GbtcB16]
QQLFNLAISPMNAYRAIQQEGIDQNEFVDDKVDIWTVLLGTWLGGL